MAAENRYWTTRVCCRVGRILPITRPCCLRHTST